MASSNDAVRRRTVDPKTEESVETTVKLATHAFDGLDLSDNELDELCDTTLSEAEDTSKKVGKTRRPLS